MALKNILRKWDYAHAKVAFIFLIKTTLTSSPCHPGLFLSKISSDIFTPPRESTGENSTNPSERSNAAENDNDNSVQQCCARDIIAYCVQFANGSRTQDDSSRSLLHIHPGNSSPLLTQFVTTTDDGLPRLCSGGMIHRYRCIRHDLSRLTIARPLDSFGCYLIIFLFMKTLV